MTGADTDTLIQRCICISPENICSSSRSLDLADSMVYAWTIVAGGGTLVSATGPATLYRPPNLATGETRTVTIKAEIQDSRGNDKVATITYTVELSRPSECEFKRKVTITKATDPGAPIVVTSSPCDCQPQPPVWIVAPALTGDAAGTLKLCVGERHLLRASGTDNDRLRLICRGTFCGLAIRQPVLLDETTYHWTSTLGGFPDYGGAADSNSRKTTVVYKAPDTPGEDEVKITIQDSGRQAPDAPLEKKIKIKSGKRTVVEEKIYPGYVLVEMIVTDASWYVVRNTPNVTGFIGLGTTPTPVDPREIETLKKRMGMSEPKYKIDVAKGDSVKIIDGPFKDFDGKIDEVDEEKGRVKVLVSIFGRETPVELDFLQINKI